MEKKYITRNHLTELSKWNPDERVLARLCGTDFDKIYFGGSILRSDLNLFSALVRCYCPEDHCFNFGKRKIVVTLDDVARIMGLPIDGKAVTGRDYQKKEFSAICSELLGSETFAKGNATSQILMADLLGLMVVPNDIEDKGLDIYVRAYVLYVIGCFIIPSKDKNKMASIFLPLLRNIDEIKEYAWGAAFLAHNMNEMRRLASNKGSTTTAACVPFFMVFSFEYVKGIASACVQGGMGNLFPPLEFPLLVSWSILLGKKTRNNYHKPSQSSYYELLSDSEIMWRPYDRLPADFLHIPLRSQLNVSYTHTILICFEQLAYHSPQICPEKLGLRGEDIIELEKLPHANSVLRTCGNKPDWREKFAEQVEAWNRRRMHYVCSYEKLVELKVVENADVAASHDAVVRGVGHHVLEENVEQEDISFSNSPLPEMFPNMPYGQNTCTKFVLVEDISFQILRCQRCFQHAIWTKHLF